MCRISPMVVLVLFCGWISFSWADTDAVWVGTKFRPEQCLKIEAGPGKRNPTAKKNQNNHKGFTAHEEPPYRLFHLCDRKESNPFPPQVLILLLLWRKTDAGEIYSDRLWNI